MRTDKSLSGSPDAETDGNFCIPNMSNEFSNFSEISRIQEIQFKTETLKNRLVLIQIYPSNWIHPSVHLDKSIYAILTKTHCNLSSRNFK